MNNLFGTDGIRAKVGDYPFNNQLPKLGKAIALWILKKYGNNPKILMVSDTRISCAWVKSTLQSALLMYPIEIYDAQILPTPAVFHIMKKLKNYSAAIVISASHNEYHDNGIKIIDSITGKLSLQDELEISSYINAGDSDVYDNLGRLEIIHLADIYIQEILSHFAQNYKSILKDKKIVLDLANGANYKIAPIIFEKLGAEVIAINNQPNGTNINKNCGALHLSKLQEAVIENSADVGFAFDGDGDRVIAINSKGEIKNGDDLIAILSTSPRYCNTNKIVGTILSNQGLEVFFKKQNKELIRTNVGDKYIMQELNKNSLILGGEQSGHIILNDIINTGDGILVALVILETIYLTNNPLMNSFTKFPQISLNIPVNTKKDLNQAPLCDFITQTQNKLNTGRLVVRYSGTEPLLRIMVEEENETLAKSAAQELAIIMQQNLL